MCVAHYDRISAPNIPNGFEVFVDESDSSENTFMARIYFIDDFGELDLINEFPFDFIPTLDELIDLDVFY